MSSDSNNTVARSKLSRRSVLKLGVAGVMSSKLLLAPSPSVAAGEKITVGGIIYARDSQFWQQIERGMRDAAKANNAELLVNMNRRQLPVESQLVDDYMTRKVDVLVIPPLDRQGSVAAARRAKEKGITVVQYDTQLEDKSIASFTVGVDSFELATTVGREMHDYIVKQLGGTASIGLISLPPMNANSAPRRAGMMKALQDVKLNIIAEVAGSTPEQGANAIENILQRDAKTQIVWASNAGTVAGAAVAATRSKSPARLYGIDMSEELAQMLLNPASNLAAVADQQPYRVGYLAVETAVKAKRGTPQPQYVAVPPKLYTKEDPAGVEQYLKLVKSLA